MDNVTKIKHRVFSFNENAILNVSMKYSGLGRVGVLLRLRGPFISLEALETAVGCLQRRHPFLRSRLKNNPASSNSYFMEEDSTLRLKIREIPRKRDQDLNFWKQEWREREKDMPIVGEGLAEFWLLQDPDDQGLREIIIVCEHCICDGLSISTVAHELLLALGEEDRSLFKESLDWPVPMETAIEQTRSYWSGFLTLSKFIIREAYRYLTVCRRIIRIPYEDVNFPLENAHKHCYSEILFDSLNKAETQRLFEKCHRENVTVTSAITAAFLRAVSTIVNNKDGYVAHMTSVDLRRRYIPPMPNELLSCQASGTSLFYMAVSDAPCKSTEMWQFARKFGQHVKDSIDAGDLFALGTLLGTCCEREQGPLSPTNCPTCGITNWGRLSFQEQYGQWKLEGMIPLGNVVRSFTPMLIVFTMNDILSIGLHGIVPVFSTNNLKKLHDNTIQYLRQMC